MSEAARRARAGVSEAAERTRDGFREASEGVRQTVSGAKERLGRLARGARDQAAGMGAGVARGAQRTGAHARRYGERAREGLLETLHRQPLVLGAVGLAIGAAIGAALPSSRREDELMGDTSDQFKQRARSAGREEYAKAKATASAAYASAAEAAAEQGLSRDGLNAVAEAARNKVESVADAATKRPNARRTGRDWAHLTISPDVGAAKAGSWRSDASLSKAACPRSGGRGRPRARRRNAARNPELWLARYPVAGLGSDRQRQYLDHCRRCRVLQPTGDLSGDHGVRLALRHRFRSQPGAAADPGAQAGGAGGGARPDRRPAALGCVRPHPQRSTAGQRLRS